MGNYSKLIGTLVGGIVGVLVSSFGLPADFATVEIQGAITVLIAGVAAFLFPANAKA